MTPENIKAAIAERATVVGELRAMADAAEGRDFSAEETVKEERFNEAINSLDSKIEGGLSDLEREALADEARARFETVTAATPPAPEVEKRSDVQRLFAGEISELSVNLPGAEQRDMLVGTATSGGNYVATSLADALYVGLRENASVLGDGLARVIVTSTGGTFSIPSVNARLAGGATAEAAAITEDDITNTTLALGANKFAVLTQASSELLEDEAVGIEAFIGTDIGEALGRAAGAAFISGTGITGGVTAGTNAKNVTFASGTAITTDELIDIQHGIASPYRTGAAWLMNDSTVKAIRKLKDTAGQYIWQPGMSVGAPSTLLGSPVVSDDNIAAIALSAVSVVYGNFQRGYVVRMVQGVKVDRSTEFAFSTDLVTWRGVLRVDGGIRDQSAIVKATQAAV